MPRGNPTPTPTSGGQNWSRGLSKFELDSRWTAEKNQENLDDLELTLKYASEKGNFDLKDLVL